MLPPKFTPGQIVFFLFSNQQIRFGKIESHKLIPTEEGLSYKYKYKISQPGNSFVEIQEDMVSDDPEPLNGRLFDAAQHFFRSA